MLVHIFRQGVDAGLRPLFAGAGKWGGLLFRFALFQVFGGDSLPAAVNKGRTDGEPQKCCKHQQG